MYPTLIAGLAMIVCGLSGRLWASCFVPPKANFGHIFGATFGFLAYASYAAFRLSDYHGALATAITACVLWFSVILHMDGSSYDSKA